MGLQRVRHDLATEQQQIHKEWCVKGEGDVSHGNRKKLEIESKFPQLTLLSQKKEGKTQSCAQHFLNGQRLLSVSTTGKLQQAYTCSVFYTHTLIPCPESSRLYNCCLSAAEREMLRLFKYILYICTLQSRRISCKIRKWILSLCTGQSCLSVLNSSHCLAIGLPCWLRGKESALAGAAGSIPGSGRSPGEGNATHSSILAWRLPWTEEPGGLQPMGSYRVRHDWDNLAHTHLEVRKFEPRLKEHCSTSGVIMILFILVNQRKGETEVQEWNEDKRDVWCQIKKKIVIKDEKIIHFRMSCSFWSQTASRQKWPFFFPPGPQKTVSSRPIKCV